MKRFDEWFTRVLMYFYMRCYERVCDYRLKRDWHIGISKHDIIMYGRRGRNRVPRRR